ncbi:MAG: CofH family radical SAM protein [Candidatus Thalassarchaeum sp.]|nr:CofH family radical SAM protein [Candidatus Thalassarchaeum sp.]
MPSWIKILEEQVSESPPRIFRKDAVELYRNADLNDLVYVANERRRLLLPGNTVTYLVDRNINYTNVCTINCHFCSFYRPPGHSETYTQTFEQISARVAELEEIGGTRILMQGGVNPDLGLDWYVDILMRLRERHPSIDLDCFSPIEIEGIAKIVGISTLEVLTKLSEAGLHGLPGGGAEMLVDDVRRGVSPQKGSSDNWIRVMGEAQSIGLVTSATNVIGLGESFDNRVEHLERIRRLQEDSTNAGYPGFTSFISWPVMLENNSLGRGNQGTNRYTLGASAIEYLRHVAISRIYLDNILHIQASWPTMGMDVAQMALFAGADDAGSTMMEENVVSASGTSKTEATIEELETMIASAGFVPAQRDSEYNMVARMGIPTNQ